jgi:CRP-like cAMP-binding protein
MLILNKYLELEEIKEIRQFFVDAGTPKEYLKNEFFMQQGQKHDYAGYIQKGGFRYLGYTSAGKEQIVGYSFENDFVVDYGSFQIQKPAVIGGQAIKNSTVLTLSHKEINTFYNKYPAFSFRSKIAETLLEDIYSRMLSLYCDSPEERYTKLIDRYPDILNLVNLKEIASLIKIAPETLSRIRKKLSLVKNP